MVYDQNQNWKRNRIPPWKRRRWERPKWERPKPRPKAPAQPEQCQKCTTMCVIENIYKYNDGGGGTKIGEYQMCPNMECGYERNL